MQLQGQVPHVHLGTTERMHAGHDLGDPHVVHSLAIGR